MVSPLEAARRQRQRGNDAAPEGNNNDNNGVQEGRAITTAMNMEEGKPETTHAAQDAAMLGRNGAMDELGVGGGGGSMEEAAERMLTRIRQKLQG